MLFDQKIEKKDITYSYEDPRMFDYLNEIFCINDNFKNKFIELKENMNIIKNETVKKDINHQFYVDCIAKYASDIAEEFYNFSESINDIYNNFLKSYSSLSNDEKRVYDNIDTIISENVFFNGNLYNLELDNFNLFEDFLDLNAKIYNKDMLLEYVNATLNENYYDKLRGKILCCNTPVCEDLFLTLVYSNLTYDNGSRQKARLVSEDKEMLLESILNTEIIKENTNTIMHDINNHYNNIINYFNEMSQSLTSNNINDYYSHNILFDAKLNECVNTIIIYNEVLGMYLNTINERSNVYTEIFNDAI